MLPMTVENGRFDPLDADDGRGRVLQMKLTLAQRGGQRRGVVGVAGQNSQRPNCHCSRQKSYFRPDSTIKNDVKAPDCLPLNRLECLGAAVDSLSQTPRDSAVGEPESAKSSFSQAEVEGTGQGLGHQSTEYLQHILKTKCPAECHAPGSAGWSGGTE